MGNSSSVGPQGPKGPQGPIGPMGPQGIPGVTTVVDGTLKNIDPSTLVPALNNVYASLPDYQQTKTDLYNSYYNKTQSDARYPSYNAFNLLNSQVNSLNNTSSYSKIDSDNKYESKTALAADVNNIVSPMLNGYEKTSSLGADITSTVGPMLNNYVQQSALTPYVKTTDLNNTLSGYINTTGMNIAINNALAPYAKTTDVKGSTFWCNGTSCNGPSGATLYVDNICSTDGTGKCLSFTTGGSGVWMRNNRNSRFGLQDDGNVVMYPNGQQAAWASGTKNA